MLTIVCPTSRSFHGRLSHERRGRGSRVDYECTAVFSHSALAACNINGPFPLSLQAKNYRGGLPTVCIYCTALAKSCRNVNCNRFDCRMRFGLGFCADQSLHIRSMSRLVPSKTQQPTGGALDKDDWLSVRTYQMKRLWKPLMSCLRQFCRHFPPKPPVQSRSLPIDEFTKLD
jgi:hypothetical protein